MGATNPNGRTKEDSIMTFIARISRALIGQLDKSRQLKQMALSALLFNAGDDFFFFIIIFVKCTPSSGERQTGFQVLRKKRVQTSGITAAHNDGGNNDVSSAAGAELVCCV